MSSVTGNKAKAKRNKQRRIIQNANKKANMRGCKNCQYSVCAKAADVAYCSVKGLVINISEDCEAFAKKIE